MCCACYGLDFQKQFWGLLFSSSFEGWEHLSVRHTKTVACPDCFWLHQPWLSESATCLSNMTFLCNNQKDTFIWKQITSFILVCIQWGAEKKNCSLLMPSDSEQKLREAHWESFTWACGRQQALWPVWCTISLPFDMNSWYSKCSKCVHCVDLCATAHLHCFEESK